MKTALYARVSTTNKGQDTELQLRDLRTYAQARNLEVHKEYIDNGISGRKDTRPALDALMDDARKRKFNSIIVWRFDRFARSTKHLVTALEEFKSLGIDFISYQENIDTSSPMGKAMFTIVAAIAELEADIIRERVMAGLANAKAKGIRLGRPGINPETAQKIIELTKKGFSLRQIAAELGVSKSLVQKVGKRREGE